MTRIDKRYVNGKPPYAIIQLPKVPQQCGVVYNAQGQPVGQTGVMCPGDNAPPVSTTPPTGTAPGSSTPSTAPNIGALLEQEVFGIPVKWLAIGAVAFFFMKK